MSFLRPLVSFLAALALGACGAGTGTAPQSASAPPPSASPQPRHFAIASNPLAVEAGLAVLRRGGSAADAAIAVQAMLSLVEPQSSGSAAARS